MVGDAWIVTLRFEDANVLGALAHFRSEGSTTAVITPRGDAIERITLRLENGVSANIAYWDYGAALTVEPVVATN